MRPWRQAGLCWGVWEDSTAWITVQGWNPSKEKSQQQQRVWTWRELCVKIVYEEQEDSKVLQNWISYWKDSKSFKESKSFHFSSLLANTTGDRPPCCWAAAIEQVWVAILLILIDFMQPPPPLHAWQNPTTWCVLSEGRRQDHTVHKSSAQGHIKRLNLVEHQNTWREATVREQCKGIKPETLSAVLTGFGSKFSLLDKIVMTLHK